MSELLQRLEFAEVLSALDVQDTIHSLPGISKCPACSTEQSLEITEGVNHTVYRCHKCGITTDALGLFKHCTEIEDDREAVTALVDMGLITPESTLWHELEAYKAYKSAVLRRFDAWRKFNTRFLNRDSFGNAVLQRHGLYSAGVDDKDMLGKYLGVATGRQIKDEMHLARGDNSWARVNSTFLVTPIWADAMTIVGFMAVKEDGQYRPLMESHRSRERGGICFLPGCRLSDDSMLICSDPIDAMREIKRGVLNGNPSSIVYAVPGTSDFGGYRLPTRVFWNPEAKPEYYRMALDCRPSAIATLDDIKNASQHDLKEATCHRHMFFLASKQIHTAIASRMARLEVPKAEVFISQLDLDTIECNKIISAASISDRKIAYDLLNSRSSERVIQFMGKKVRSTTDGWFYEDARGNRERITDTTFVIESVYCDQKAKTSKAAGTIYQGTRSISFQSDFEKMRKKPYKWLTDVCMEHKIDVPDVRRQWENRLFDVSTAFHKFGTKYSATTTSWTESGDALMMPGVIIADGKVKDNTDFKFSDVAGAGFTPATTTTIEDEANLSYDDDAGACFWGLFGAVAMNVLNAYHGRGTTGIGVIGPQDASLFKLVRQSVAEVGMHTVAFYSASKSKLDDIIMTERHCPFPIFISEHWNTNDTYRRWLQTGAQRNAIVQMTSTAAVATALEGGWTYLSCASLSESYTRMEGLWKVFPLFIAYVQSKALSREGLKWPEGPNLLFHFVLDLIKEWTESLNLDCKDVLKRVLEVCTPDMADQNTAFAVRFVNFLADSVGCEKIGFRMHDATKDYGQDVICDTGRQLVFVSRDAIDNLFEESGVRPIRWQHIRDELRTMDILRTERYGGFNGYGICFEYWTLNQHSRPLTRR